MSYSVVFTDEARKALKTLDKHISKLIMSWMRKNLVGCSHPRAHGKGRTSNRSGQWRYRVGDYRILAEIEDARVVILVLSVGHRRDVYM